MQKSMQNLLLKLKNTIIYQIVLILLFVTIYPKFPFVRVPGTFVSIRVEDILIGGMFFVNLPLIIGKYKKLLSERVTYSYLLFLFGAFLSLLAAIFITKTILIHIGTLHFLRRVEYFIPFLLTLLIPMTKKNLQFLTAIIIVILMIVFAYGFGQKYYNLPVIVTQNEEYSRGIALRYQEGGHLNSTFAGHYDLASVLILVLPFFITLFSLRKKMKKNAFGNLLLLVSVVCGIWLLAFSGSRISTFSFMVAFILALSINRKILHIGFFILLSLAILGLSPSLRERYIRIYDVVKTKIIEMGSIFASEAYAVEPLGVPEKHVQVDITPTQPPIFEDRSTSIRLNIEWPRALRSFYKNPLLGTGYSSITLATDNDYLRLLGETGIVGIIGFTVFIISIFTYIKYAVLNLSLFDTLEKAYVSSFSSSLLGVFINAFFIDIFEASKFAIVFWIFLGIFVKIVATKMKTYGNI